MTDGTTPRDPLAALGAHLSARRLEVELTAHGLRVTNPAVPGCCPDATPATEVVTCRPRTDDGERMWFFASGHEPIAETDQIMNAVTEILGRLVFRLDGTEASQ